MRQKRGRLILMVNDIAKKSDKLKSYIIHVKKSNRYFSIALKIVDF